MLYDLHELQRSMLSPLARFTDSGSLLFSSPYSPLAYTPLSRHIAAAYELMHRLGKEYENLHGAWIQQKLVVKPSMSTDTVLQKPFCHLVHFRRDLPASHAPDPVCC